MMIDRGNWPKGPYREGQGHNVFYVHIASAPDPSKEKANTRDLASAESRCERPTRRYVVFKLSCDRRDAYSQ